MYRYMSKNTPRSISKDSHPTYHGIGCSHPSQPSNCITQPPYKMARNIDSWQRKMITHMTCSKNRLTTSQMAKVAQCSERSITKIRKNLRLFGSARSPQVSVSRQPSIAPIMFDGLCDHLAEKPGLYVEEMAIFLRDEFNILPSSSSIKRALSHAGWTKKKAQQKAKEQNPQIRDLYQHKLSDFRSYHLVFVDESVCDKRIGYRRTGW